MSSKRFNKAIGELRSEAPSSGIERARATWGMQRDRPSRRAWWAVPLAAAGLAAAVFFVPRPAEAVPLSAMVQAITGQDRYHWVFTGKDHRFERWRDGQKLRYSAKDRFSNFDRAFDGKRVWMIDHTGRYVRIRTEAPSGFGEGDERIDAFLGRMESYAEDIKPTYLHSNGRHRLVLDYRFKKDPRPRQRYEIEYEPRTRLPLSVVRSERQASDWVEMSRGKMTWPENLPDDVFSVRPPNGYRVYDLDAVREAILERSEKEPSIWRGSAEVKLLGVFQGRGGDLTTIWFGPEAVEKGSVGGVRRAAGRWPRPGERFGHSALLVPTNEAPADLGTRASLPTLKGVAVRAMSTHMPKVEGNPPMDVEVALPVPGGSVQMRTRTTPLPMSSDVFDLLDPERPRGWRLQPLSPPSSR